MTFNDCGEWILQDGSRNGQASPPDLVGADLGVYVPSESLYCKFEFTHWGVGGSGNGEVGWKKNCFYDL
jgi:hypothetical protein